MNSFVGEVSLAREAAFARARIPNNVADEFGDRGGKTRPIDGAEAIGLREFSPGLTGANNVLLRRDRYNGLA
ncbi:MAG: hypothetical protein ACLPX9_13645 [Rhodomicrobium sp.]